MDSPHSPHSPLLGWGAVLEGEGGAGRPETCREARAEASSGGRPLLGEVALVEWCLGGELPGEGRTEGDLGRGLGREAV